MSPIYRWLQSVGELWVIEKGNRLFNTCGRVAMEFYIRDNGFVMAAAVECEVDGISERLHEVRIQLLAEDEYD